MTGEIVSIDENGCVTRKKKKFWHKRKDRKSIELKRHSRKKLNNTTRSETHQQFAFTHGARIMKNTGKFEERVSGYDSTEISEKPSVNYPIDHRCHPAIKPE